MVTIPQHTPILTLLGGIYGPINTPHMRDVTEIGLLLKHEVHLESKMSDGQQVRLTLENYRNEHAEEHVPDKEEPQHPVPPIEIPNVEVPTAPKDDSLIDIGLDVDLGPIDLDVDIKIPHLIPRKKE